jgi:hypothetical protein
MRRLWYVFWAVLADATATPVSVFADPRFNEEGKAERS